MAQEFKVTAGRMTRFLGAGVMAMALMSAAHAQDYNQPPSDVPGDAQSQSGALAVRIDRLEAALRRATGEIEDLQNENRKLADQLKRFRDDVEFRLSGKSGQAAPAGEPPSIVADSDDVSPARPEPAAPPRPHKGDAFDPDADPNAAGAPRQIGTTQASQPLTLSSHVSDDAAAPPPLKPLPTPERMAKATSDEGEPNFVSSGVPFSDSREQYKSAVAAYKAGQYADAEAQFKAYLDANKGAYNAADAVFYIGETYMQRSRLREAAEQYLKVSTEYAKSPRAPESMVRLGLALAKLGNTEQACATFAEVGKRYPSSAMKRNAEHESQTLRCS